jgi:hypothetical protein
MRNFISVDLVKADLTVHRIDKNQREDGDEQPRTPPARVALQVGESFRGCDEGVDDARAFRK